jgi:hypothetical protein
MVMHTTIKCIVAVVAIRRKRSKNLLTLHDAHSCTKLCSSEIHYSAGLLWLRLALAYEKEAAKGSSCGAKSRYACAAASLSRRCLTASIAHYKYYSARMDGSGTCALGGSLPAALEAARSIYERHVPDGHVGGAYVLPLSADVPAFEQQWLGGGAAAEAALQKVICNHHS